ncbi:hypothetical protein [Alkaliphilus sp. B6464]|uniref:hypothetical protein n=1 Tax=Alkaliphilus sp. B6464 TaxID=2731219 RepID=UPI001BA4CBE7|nr:hypothetical protein [Alkaliphilus sp. B6464]QUH20092.1 hypothetical protein HYG84_09360 [Alkaliphilus sp. B6464]
MKKSLIMLLVLVSITLPAFQDIDAYSGYNSKLLVIDESINTFNTECFYKIGC